MDHLGSANWSRLLVRDQSLQARRPPTALPLSELNQLRELLTVARRSTAGILLKVARCCTFDNLCVHNPFRNQRSRVATELPAASYWYHDPGSANYNQSSCRVP